MSELTQLDTDRPQASSWRFRCVIAGLAGVFLVMVWRVVDLQVIEQRFLSGQGDARTLRVETISAHRGMIMDRNGEPLAVSTPVSSIWVNPRQIDDIPQTARMLARQTGLNIKIIKQRLTANRDKQFVYIKRHMPPATAEAVVQAAAREKLRGIYIEKEYKRYYPAGEITSHLVGFTNIDDSGQEGIELAYDEWLHGTVGKKVVLKDRTGRVLKDVRPMRDEKVGQNLKLSIDLRLQYLAYRELLAAVKAHKAKSGSMVMLDANTGEVLAMVNQPSYNPNQRATINHANLRNRAVTDVFEPGSTMKPLTVAAALEAGEVKPHTRLNTSPGYLRLGRNTIRDHRNYGTIDITSIITKSSNVGTSKLALAMGGDTLRDMFARLGLGQDTGSGFPGERGGLLPHHRQWRDVEQATLSYGYGLSVTALQLAQAYTAFANEGELKPVSLLAPASDTDNSAIGQQVMAGQTADQVLAMLETVVSKKGTGSRAGVQGYRVAGKTGTVHKLSEGGYQQGKYLSLFAGVAPVTNPQVVAVVLIDEPGGDHYYGGEIAAPVFSRVVGGAMRILNVSPDDAQQKPDAARQAISVASRSAGGPA